MANLTTKLLTAALILLLLPAGAQAAPKPKVVASFTILADMARQIGGDAIEVITLVGPNGDAHLYQPSPADAKTILASQMVLINGLEFESWILRLIESSNYIGRVTIASQGIAMIPFTSEQSEHAHTNRLYDPHAWQSLPNAKIYVHNIAEGLSRMDPPHAQMYRANAARYTAQIDELDMWARDKIASVPEHRRVVITSHDAFGYFAQAYNVRFIPALGVSTDGQPSAGDIAALVDQVRSQKVLAVFVENVSDKRLMQQLERDAGAHVGGVLYSDSLSEPDGPAADYLSMFRYNVTQLVSAMNY